MFTKMLSTTFSAKFSAVVIPVAALVFALTPGVASADLGGPVLQVSPNASIVAGVEVAGAQSSSNVLSCLFGDNGTSVQTCLLPAGLGPDAAVIAAPNANVEIAGVSANALGAASYSCAFDGSASGPQTCSINS
jgi:hypothetical protein